MTWLLAFLLPLWARGEEVTLTNGEWPPYLSEYEPNYGIASHIVTDAFALEGVTVRYVFRPWRRAYAEAESGKYHGSVVWTFEPDRAEKFFFSDAVFEGKSVFFHLKSNPVDWKTYDDLINLRVGGTNGYDYAFERNPRIKVERANSDVENFRKLLAGRFDIFPSDLNVGYALLQKNFVTAEFDLITHHPKVYNVVSYFLILSKANPDNAKLLLRFNRGLKKLRESGRYEEYFKVAR
ncbi:substrate-binding periplasmic protein [Chitinimonas arctica]|uniref:substrate-binding periplasmic protein n=1 Tax=Chitinimonas arctica TaxID=2594795 RepID=UPI0015D43A7C|nr:transporter substrate-binding domain-containing protein [Chitinimonas arctica]